MDTPYDSVHFLKVVNETLKDYKATAESKKVTCEHLASQKLTSSFFRQQELVGQFINDETPYRGLHLYWGLGTGKTGAAIKISENSKKRKVVYLIPTKGLLPEVYDQLSIFGDPAYRKAANYDSMSPLEKEAELERIKKEINKRYSIITYNSTKIINKLYSMGSIEYKMSLEDIMDDKVNYTEKNPLNGKLVIIDEVHNMLRQMIAEGSKTGSALFHMIMEAKDVKIVTLSGTPIADDPFNLAALFNMLRGYIRIGPETFTLFPSDYQQFTNYFVDEDTNRIKNEKVFSERITGLVSYYHGIYDESSELFPSSKEHIIN
jgi:superfamily II DNA or RNA helicase